MKKTLVAVLPLLIAIVAASCASSTAPVVALPEPASKSDMAMNCQDYPIETDIWNPCCEEMQHMTAVRHFCIANRLDENLQAILRMNFSDLSINGPSGTSHGNGIVHETMRFSLVNDGEVVVKQGSATYRMHVTSQNGCGYTYVFKTHVVLDGTGQIHILQDTISIECR